MHNDFHIDVTKTMYLRILSRQLVHYSDWSFVKIYGINSFCILCRQMKTLYNIAIQNSKMLAKTSILCAQPTN